MFMLSRKQTSKKYAMDYQKFFYIHKKEQEKMHKNALYTWITWRLIITQEVLHLQHVDETWKYCKTSTLPLSKLNRTLEQTGSIGKTKKAWGQERALAPQPAQNQIHSTNFQNFFESCFPLPNCLVLICPSAHKFYPNVRCKPASPRAILSAASRLQLLENHIWPSCCKNLIGSEPNAS